MLTTAKVCALLLGTTVLNVGGTVVVMKEVQHRKTNASASVPKKVKTTTPRPKKVTSRPPAEPSSLKDCPTASPSLGSGDWKVPPLTTELTAFLTEGRTPPRGILPPEWIVIDPGLPPIPGIPAPDTWVMMVAGFGLVGLSFRRKDKK
jgi:hypothetical protein